jgi:hypothetical protein
MTDTDTPRTPPDAATTAMLDQVREQFRQEHLGVDPEVFVVVFPASEFGQLGPNCYLGETPVVEVGAVGHGPGYRRYCAGGLLPDRTRVKTEIEVVPA